MSRKRLVVIGGGAAGFFCAVNAARMNPELEVILVEKTNKLLSKVRVSGGGRCNVTHACFSIPEMLQKYPRGFHFLKKTFHQFFTKDTIHWFEERGVKLKKEEDGRMFPISDSSQTIIDCLMREAEKYGVKISTATEVRGLQNDGGKFIIQLADLISHNHSDLPADFICIACGAYNKSSQFNWLKQLGHTIEEPVPSLFTFNMPGNPVTRLMGISVEDVEVRIREPKWLERGPLLITHWGMSGPVVLRLSAWAARQLAICNWQFVISINWVPTFNEQSLRENIQQIRFDRGAQRIIHRNPFGLPQRLWEFILEQSGVQNELRWADLPAKDQNKLINNLDSQEFPVKGKTTFKEEFVTAGGIKLSEIDGNTMQSKLVPHLYFAGEVMDVDGITGGFNFQHAWSSGIIAGMNIASKTKIINY